MALLFPFAASGLDLDALDGQRKRDACVAYVWIDLLIAHQTGSLDDQGFANGKMKLMAKVYQSHGSNVAPGLDTRINQLIAEIMSKNPTVAELSGKAAACRAWLRF